MSRAQDILGWVMGQDEEAPAAFSVDDDAGHKLTKASGYTYQDRGQKDQQGDTKDSDGTKPAGLNKEGKNDRKMPAPDKSKMDVR
jgi:hypothetical protein